LNREALATSRIVAGNGARQVPLAHAVAASSGVAIGEIALARGARTSHAAVVARQLGKVCLVGCAELQIDEVSSTITRGEVAELRHLLQIQRRTLALYSSY